MMYLTYQLAQIRVDEMTHEAAQRSLARQAAAAVHDDPRRAVRPTPRRRVAPWSRRSLLHG